MLSEIRLSSRLISRSNAARSAPLSTCAKCQCGMTLIELMVAMALGLLVLGVVAVIFSGTSGNRAGLERGGRLAENAAYAVGCLRAEVRMAGFFATTKFTGFHWHGADARPT